MVLHFNPVHLGFPFWAGRDWGQKEKGMTEDEMAGWHHWLDGREFGWTPGVGDGQGGLACCDSWGRQESDTTEQLNWTELNFPWSVRLSLRLAFLPHGCPIALAPLVDQVIVPPRNCFYIFVICQLGVSVCVYLWVFCSIPLISVSMLHQYHNLNYCNYKS